MKVYIFDLDDALVAYAYSGIVLLKPNVFIHTAQKFSRSA